MAESFGARVRRQRERQQIALASIAEQTKISLSLLEGLERDDLSRWPTGIFRRAFIRAYAHAIGLEPDAVVREFLEVHPDPVEVDATVAVAPPPTGDEPAASGPPSRLRRLIDRAIGSFPRRRPPLSLLSPESTLESATTVDRESLKAVRPPGSDKAAAARFPARTAIERAKAVDRDSAKAASPRKSDLAAAARLSTRTPLGIATTVDRDSVKAASPREADPSAATRPSTGIAIERAAAAACDSGKTPSPRKPEPASAARFPADNAIESATAAAFDSVKAPPPPEPDLAAAAHLCTELGRVLETRDVAPLLEGAAKVLHASGLIVWIWDPHGTALRPALAHGYSADVLAQLPEVRRDADNATATAFRSAQTRIVNGSDLASGAVVVPLMTPGGCGGVLAVELKHGREQNESVRALAMIFAAQLATLVGFVPFAEAVNA